MSTNKTPAEQRTANQVYADVLAAAVAAGWGETKPVFRITRHEYRTLLMEPLDWQNMVGLGGRNTVQDSPEHKTMCGLPLEIVP